MAASAAEREELQRYLDGHQVEPRLNELLNRLTSETPAKPFGWMADKLLEAAGPVAAAQTWPSKQVAAADPSMAALVRQWDGALSFSSGGGGSGSGVAAAPAAPPPAAKASAAPAASAAAPPAAGGNPDKDAKKAAKAEEKRKKEEEKERKRKEREEAERKKLEGPDVPNVTLLNFMDYPFGQLMIQSHCTTERKWTDVGELTPKLSGTSVWLRVRLHNTRKQSAKLGFVELRQRLSTVQGVVQGKDLAAFACGLPKESVLDVYAEVISPDKPTSCTQSDVELNVTRVYCVTKALPRLPLQVEDAARSEAEAKRLKLPRVAQDTRLDNRVIDMRTSANQGIFRIQSEVCALFREKLLSQGFAEIHSPKMIATASEGGADVFKLTYFDRHAFLAQSPQLYKQMALMADMGRVFEIGPVFRSEKSFTHRHMTEFTGLDMEMCFKEHYHEVLDMLDRTFNAVFDGLNAQYKAELDTVRAQHPFQDLRYKYPCLRFQYPEAMAHLRKHGPALLKKKAAAATDPAEKAELLSRVESVANHGDTEDLGTADERLLGEIVGSTHGQDFYIIDKFPAYIRPFYTMPDPADPTFSNSYDIFIRGEEVTSGAQRIHDPQMLLDRAASMDPPVDLAPIQDYVNSFKYGAFPHAGGGIGLERVVMLFCQLSNIRKSSLFPRDPKRLSP